MGDVVQRSEMEQDEQHKLLFGVRRSARYHVRRRQNFERLDKFIKVFTTIGGLGTVTTILAKTNEWWTLGYGTAAGFFSLIDIVIGTNDLARTHADLATEFILLEKDMVLAGESLSKSELAKFTGRRLDIEMKEPPPLRVLDRICYNELIRAMGYDKSCQKKVTWWQQFLSPFCDWRFKSTD